MEANPDGADPRISEANSTGSRLQIVSAISALWADGWWFRTPLAGH
jgi:hypothetical protein